MLINDGQSLLVELDLCSASRQNLHDLPRVRHALAIVCAVMVALRAYLRQQTVVLIVYLRLTIGCSYQQQHSPLLCFPGETSGGCENDGQNFLPSGFYEDVKSLFGQLSSLSALERACDAAVRAALPSLGDVRKLLEVRSAGPPMFYRLLKNGDH